MLIFNLIMGVFKNKKTTKLPYSKNLLFLQKLIEATPNPMYYTDENGILKYCNKAFADYLSTNTESVIGRNFSSLCYKNDGILYYEIDKKLINRKEKQVYLAKLKDRGQISRYVTITQTRLLEEGCDIRGVIGNITDVSEPLISERKIRAILKLKEAMLDINQIIIKENNINVLLNLVLEKVTDAIENADIGAVLILGDDNNVKIIASKGYDEEEVTGLKIELNQVFYMIKMKGVIGNAVIINNIEDFDMEEHGEVLDSKEGVKLKCSISTPILLDGKLYGFINVDSTCNNAFDENDIEVLDYLKKQIEVGISKIKLYEETIYLSRCDRLTNTYNRGYFEEIFNITLQRAEENIDIFSLVIFDLNLLKVVNDCYGHLAGDEVIRTFASKLKANLGERDILGRVGGDEFSTIIFDSNLEKLFEKLENLNNELNNSPICFDGQEIICNFSYGISNYPIDGGSYNSLVKAADVRMYGYKNKRKL